MMEAIPTCMKEFPLSYPGMSGEDYLYMQHIITKKDPEFRNNLLKRRLQVPPYEKRTKEIVFRLLDADPEYQFDSSMI